MFIVNMAKVSNSEETFIKENNPYVLKEMFHNAVNATFPTFAMIWHDLHCPLEAEHLNTETRPSTFSVCVVIHIEVIYSACDTDLDQCWMLPLAS